MGGGYAADWLLRVGFRRNCDAREKQRTETEIGRGREREREGERSVGKARKRLLYEFFLVFFRLTSNELEVSHVQSRPLDVRSCAARCTKMQEAEKERGYSKSN